MYSTNLENYWIRAHSNQEITWKKYWDLLQYALHFAKFELSSGKKWSLDFYSNMKRIRSTSSINISPEITRKLYEKLSDDFTGSRSSFN